MATVRVKTKAVSGGAETQVFNVASPSVATSGDGVVVLSNATNSELVAVFPQSVLLGLFVEEYQNN